MTNLGIGAIIFYFIFDVLLLLLLLFGDSFLGIYVIGLFSFFFLVNIRKLDFSKVNTFKIELLLWFTLLLGLLVSSFFTHSVSLTINAYIYYLFGFSFFSFFLLLKKKYLDKKFLIYNIFLVIFSLSVLSLGFSFFPSYAENMPGMNLVYSSYGHNHFGILIILILPVIWFLMKKSFGEKREAILLMAFVLLLFVNLLMSFGRILVFTAIIELFVLFFLDLKSQSKIRIAHLFLGFLLMMAVFAFFLKNSFSIVSIFKSDINCPFPDYKDKVCKDISRELRSHYWNTAINGISDNWLIGYGPGNYSLVGEKYKLRPDSGTSYAHNSILHVLAEGGIVMGIPFFLLFVFYIVKSFRKVFFVKKSTDDTLINKYLLIGLLALLINSMFDYDLNYVGVFALVFLFFSLILRAHSIKRKHKKNSSLVFKLTFIGSLSFIVTLTTVSLSTEYFIYRGDVGKAFDFFPYFQSHMKLFLNEEDLGKKREEKLISIYKNFSFIYANNLIKDDFEKYFTHIKEISPWYFYQSDSLKKIISREDLVYEEMMSISEKYTQAKELGYIGSVVYDRQIASMAIRTADKYLEKHDYKKAADLYEVAFQFHEWIFNDSYPAFLYLLKDDQSRVSFWIEMDKIPGNYYNKHYKIVAESYRPMVNFAIENKDVDLLIKVIDKILEISPDSVDPMEFDELPKIQKYVNKLILSSSWIEAESVLKKMYLFNSYFAKIQLGNFYILRGEKHNAREAYDNCLIDWQNLRNDDHFDCRNSLKDFDKLDEKQYWLDSDQVINY